MKSLELRSYDDGDVEDVNVVSARNSSRFDEIERSQNCSDENVKRKQSKFKAAYLYSYCSTFLIENEERK